MQEQLGAGGLSGLAESLASSNWALIAGVALLAAIWLARRSRRPGLEPSNPGIASRIGSIVLSAATTNWQLAILGTAAAVLSFAAGWRTWDGMQNFTGEPIASLLMTIGIQAVMLIIAWLIGESFASGLRTRRAPNADRNTFWSRLEPAIGGLVGALCAVGVIAAIANAFGAFDDMRQPSGTKSTLLTFADKSLYIGVGLLVLATVLINQRSDVVQPYLQSARLIARNAMLWVMFLLCMATGVFFSFDSFFNSIFPASERGRAAEIRSQRQIAGVVNDTGVLAFRRQAEEAEQLFQSPGWVAYERNLSELARASQGAEQEIERFFVDRMETQKSAIATQQERIATARSGQAGLSTRKAVITDELSRLKGERPALAAELAEKKSELDNRAKGLDAKRVEMMAEERGAEGTLKIGQGPVYRQRRAELHQLQDAFKIQEERVRDAQKRLQTVDTRLAQVEREVAALDGDIAKLKGEADTAAQRIEVSQASRSGDGAMPKVDPARVRAAFEKAHQEFRQEPAVERLTALASQCTQLLGAMSSTPATRDRVRDIDCNPKQAAEAASRVFALNAGLVTFAQNCTGGSKLPIDGGTDALLTFGRKCLQDSGLPTADSSDMAARISAIDLNRDDKAHRFVVTWNAFADGNRLAYLALAIAIALDSLIFMAGLFGANAVRSPLTEIDHHGEMSADQLEAAVDATLGQTIDPIGTISALLSAMHPVRNVDGFASEIVLDDHDPLVEEMRKVLNAGSNISAVQPVGETRGRYLVHAGFTRYLTLAQRKNWKVRTAEVDRKQLVNFIGVALLPSPGPQTNADIVLGHMHPISDSRGFAAETSPFQIQDAAERRLVMKVLGAGATVAGTVKRHDDGRYFVSTDFYKTLLLMRAAAIPAFRPDTLRLRYGDTGSHGAGTLSAAPPQALEAIPDAPRLAHRGGGEQQTRGSHPPELPQNPRGPRASAASRPVISMTGTPMSADRAEPPPPIAPLPRSDLERGGASGAAASRKPSSSRLATEIRSKVIAGALERWGTWGDDEIEAIWHSRPEPIADALRSLIERKGPVGLGVEQLVYEIEQGIADTYDRLQQSTSADAQVLESVVNSVKQRLPALMLTADGPYQQLIETMIHELTERGATLEDQAGSGRLSEREVARLRTLDAHFRAFVALDGMIDRDERLVRLIADLREVDRAFPGERPADGSPMT